MAPVCAIEREQAAAAAVRRRLLRDQLGGQIEIEIADVGHVTR